MLRLLICIENFEFEKKEISNLIVSGCKLLRMNSVLWIASSRVVYRKIRHVGITDSWRETCKAVQLLNIKSLDSLYNTTGSYYDKSLVTYLTKFINLKSTAKSRFNSEHVATGSWYRQETRMYLDTIPLLNVWRGYNYLSMTYIQAGDGSYFCRSPWLDSFQMRHNGWNSHDVLPLLVSSLWHGTSSYLQYASTTNTMAGPPKRNSVADDSNWITVDEITWM